MSWLEFIEHVKNKDCKVSQAGDFLMVTCNGKEFYVGIDLEECDLTVTTVED